MAAPRITAEGLTAKQEHFAQLVASGEYQSAAYRTAYSPSPETLPASVDQMASRLASDVNVATRIQQLVNAAATLAVADAAWDKVRLINEAAENLHGSRAAKQWGSANGALEIIGRATGLLSDRHTGSGDMVRVTQVTIVTTDPGASIKGARVVDVMPVVQAPEDTPEPHEQIPEVT